MSNHYQNNNEAWIELNKEKSSCKVRSQYNTLSIVWCSHTSNHLRSLYRHEKLGSSGTKDLLKLLI